MADEVRYEVIEEAEAEGLALVRVTSSRGTYTYLDCEGADDL